MLPFYRRPSLPLAILAGFAVLPAVRAHAYIDLAPTLPKIIAESKKIALVEVTKFDAETGVLVLKEIRTSKGDPSTDPIRQKLTSQTGLVAPRPIRQWASPGAQAVVFSASDSALVCFGEGWYQVRATGNGAWLLTVDRPDLPLAYYGNLSRLTAAVDAIIAGKVAIITAVAYTANEEGVSFDLALNHQALPGLVKLQRIRASATMPSSVAGASNNPAYFAGVGTVDVADIPALLQQLKSTSAMTRAQAAEDLRSLETKADPATGALKTLTADSAPAVRFAAASALLRIHPSDEAPIEILRAGLLSKDNPTRHDAVRNVGFAGPAAASLTPQLAKLLQDSDESIRISALQSIALLGPAAAVAVPAVTPLLENADTAIDAADALGRIGSAAQPALKQLTTMLQSDQPAVRWAAVRAMAQIGGQDAHPAVDFMIHAFPTATEVEGYNMLIYFALLGPVASDAVPTISSTHIKNPVLPSATLWAIAPDTSLPWKPANTDSQSEAGGRRGGFGGPGGLGGGGGAILAPTFTFVYESYVHHLGDRLKPASRMLAEKIMDNTAGDVPAWGYKILSAGPDQSLAVLVPHLADVELAPRERAAVALGYMGPAAARAKPRVEAAIKSAATPSEKLLLQWCLREISAE